MTAGTGGSASGQAGEGGNDAASGAGGAPDWGPLAPLIAAYCGAARACCAQAGAPLGSLSGCEQAFANQSDNVALAKSGNVDVEPNALAACVRAYDAAKTSCVLDVALAACHGILVGKIAEGGPCSDVLECDRSKAPKVCLKLQDSSEMLGVCQTPPRGKDGDACAQSCEEGANCSSNVSAPDASVPTTLCYEKDGLYCPIGMACAPIALADDDCVFDEACGSSGYCDSTCKALGQAGDACQFNFGCAAGLACIDDACAPEPVASDETCVGYPPSFD